MTPEKIEPSCAEALPLVDGSLFDCVTGNVALLLAHAGVEDVYEPFAADWRLELAADAGPDGALPTFALPPPDRDELAGRRTGLRPVWRESPDLAGAVRDWRSPLRAGRPVLVIADAYALPWLPYHGREHMEHGFVICDLTGEGDVPGAGGRAGDVRLGIVDPYENVTEWGRAQPVATRQASADLRAAWPAEVRWAVLERTGEVGRPVDPLTQLRANARQVVTAAPAVTERCRLNCEVLDRPAVDHLALQTWLLLRSRRLHHRWLSGLPAVRDDRGLATTAEHFATRVIGAWERAAQAAYLAVRRVRSGRTAPPAVLGRVRTAVMAEREVARELLDVSARATRTASIR